MIDISKGRYWDEGITLIDGCTPCSPGCDHCWSAAMTHRLGDRKRPIIIGKLTNDKGKFTGDIVTHPDRLKRFNTRKPKVFAIWNDLFHADVPDEFIDISLSKMEISADHPPWGDKVYKTQFGADGCYEPNKYLILTKRPLKMLQSVNSFLDSFSNQGIAPRMDHIYFGLTVCNQQEWDDKKKQFQMVPGKKFLSLEPLLGNIDLKLTQTFKEPFFGWPDSEMERMAKIDAVILGGETGPGARPMNPDWVRSVRDQCAAAGVPFFFKGWGKWKGSKDFIGNVSVPGSERIGRLLDGRTHDDLPWVKKEGEIGV